MTKRLVVIGGVAAGMSAAAKARRLDPELEVLVYEKGPHISYAACGMPYFLAGDVPDHQQLMVRTPEQMARQGVRVHINHEVTGIHPSSRSVIIQDLLAGRELTETYDHLVIACGARPASLPLPGVDLDGVFAMRSLVSGLTIKQFLQEHRPQRALVVGGGYVGLEMAETFRRLGLDVKMLIRSGQVLRTSLDDDLRKLVEGELVRNGVDIIRAKPLALEGQDRVSSLVLDGEDVPCDIVLLGMGVRPNVELAHGAGVALGATGAIATDSAMRTNLPDVYAAGDCAEALHLVTGEPAHIPLGSTANKQGRVAGTNAAGGRATFGGVLGTMAVRVFDLTVARTGLTTVQARAAGLQPQGTTIRATDIAHYFPGAADIHVKLIVDTENGRLLGGQIVGRHGVAKRIDVLATAIHHRLTVGELQRLDLSYAPPFAPAWDSILVAANVAAG
jgi:NADPH-dependent 2,4-dienoyl-CoA reductase/sulfur reductase-like enzyme